MKTIYKYVAAGHRILTFFITLVKSKLFTKRFNILCCLILLLVKSSYGQLNSANVAPDEMGYIGFGVSNVFLNRQEFDKWTIANYNLKESSSADFLIDVGLFKKRFDFGGHFDLSRSFSAYSFYAGYRLTGQFSPISSWLNFEVGGISGIFTNIAPLNYTPTSDQAGQKLELHYTPAFIGLTSKNYLNFLHFRVKLGKAVIPFNSGFFVGAAIQPGSRDWKYGYYNTDTVFTSVKIHSIPKLGRVQVNAGLFTTF